MENRKKVTYFIAMSLIVSIVTSCGTSSEPENAQGAGIQQDNLVDNEEALAEKNEKIITAQVEKYLSDTIFQQFDQQDVLYDKYIMISSVNILSSLINIIDGKIGEIEASLGVNDEVAKFVLENFEGSIEELIFEKDGVEKLKDIVTKDCKTKILGISATENKNEYMVKIKVTNMDFFGNANSSDAIKEIIENIQVGDVLNSDSIKGAAMEVAKEGVKTVFSSKDRKKKIFMAALKGLVTSSGKEGIKGVADIFMENMGASAITNSYTGEIKVALSDDKALIVEQDKQLINACYSIFDEKVLEMEASSLYDEKVTELLAIKEEREQLAEAEAAQIQDDYYEDENNSSYILANSDSEYLTEHDLVDLSSKQLTYARNEIYARHGYVFKSDELNSYFGQQDWYEADDEFDGNLDDVETYNAEFILTYQNEYDMTYKPK